LSRKEKKEIQKEYTQEYGEQTIKKQPNKAWIWIKYSVMLLFGMGLTIWGADLLVEGAVQIAQTFGLSDAIIGLTIVAIGTSAPELGTTIVATIKNDRDVAIGNLIGSSISNILVILGITCLASPGGISVGDDILWFDIPLGAFVAIMCYPVFRKNRMVSRTNGIVFVILYLAYLASLIIFRT
jgi:cation:H+ antiporter